MMAFFTPYYKKSSQFIGWFLLGCACLAWAATSSLNIKTAELVLVEDAYLLNADIETVFSDQIEDAINKGVPLNFLVEFQLVAPRKYWFDDEIVTATSEVTLSYHALSRQYLFQRNGHQHSFISLQEVKTEFSKIRNWKVLDKAKLPKEESYRAVLLVRLDQTKLPKPLQVDALGSDEWSVTSQRYLWIPTFANP